MDNSSQVCRAFVQRRHKINMENSFKYSDDNKRYHTWNYHLRHKFGCKVFKVPLNGGFTCPNRDGTRGTGGCTYCSALGSGDFAGDASKSIPEQFAEIKARMHKKWPQAKYIAYFQANTNTYAPVEVLREKFEAALSEENVVGLSIATRPDCLPAGVLEYLEELSRRTYLTVELGLQTIHDKTGVRINRCHSYAEFLEGFGALRERGINICVHLINGLPGETREMMLQSAAAVAALRPHCVKLHLLHVLKGTKIAAEYNSGGFKLMSLDDYVDIIVSQLELFHEDTIIQRLTGDGARDELIGPLWSLKKFVVLNEIDKEMARRKTYQGAGFGKVSF